MKPSAYLLDTGPIVAVLNRRDQHHAWARRTLDGLDARVLTCEAVLSEAWFLVRHNGADPIRVLELVRAMDAEIVQGWSMRADKLLRRYVARASVADAVLLALAEEKKDRIIVTTDRVDFGVYRVHRRRVVPTLVPPE